jgi:hypothetical protein
MLQEPLRCFGEEMREDRLNKKHCEPGISDGAAAGGRWWMDGNGQRTANNANPLWASEAADKHQ